MKRQTSRRGLPLLAVLLPLLLAACAVAPPCECPPKAKPEVVAPRYAPASWAELPGWQDDVTEEAWPALLRSCKRLATRIEWAETCVAARAMGDRPERAAVRSFFEERFAAYAVSGGDGRGEGLLTGYYEPVLEGCRERSESCAHPVYGVPEDLVVVDLASLYPELKSMRLRGRLEGRRLLPYYSRGELEGGAANPPVLAWVRDPVALFFLHIQGSGRIRLESGEALRVGYADQNGHPYRAIGRVLVERGELSADQASMQGIRAWAQANPDRVRELLDANPSYVFFRTLPPAAPEEGPPGALGVPLTAGRSIAVDPRAIPLGMPVFIAATRADDGAPLNRLVLAQDTGGAIRGAVRADFYWGGGDDAGELAGRTRQPLRVWLLWPKGRPLP